MFEEIECNSGVSQYRLHFHLKWQNLYEIRQVLSSFFLNKVKRSLEKSFIFNLFSDAKQKKVKNQFFHFFFPFPIIKLLSLI